MSEQTYRDVVGLRVDRMFTEEPVSAADLERILEAARWTGSSKNSQSWHFVVVDDREGLDALATAGSFTRPLRNASLAIALVQEPDGYEFDIGRAAQNMMLAASALGIGSCPVTLHEEDRAREVLGVPEDHRCRYAVAFGHPDRAAEEQDRRRRRDGGRPHGRKPLDEIVSHRTFGTAPD
jgi:nitroreductase